MRVPAVFGGHALGLVGAGVLCRNLTRYETSISLLGDVLYWILFSWSFIYVAMLTWEYISSKQSRITDTNSLAGCSRVGAYTMAICFIGGALYTHLSDIVGTIILAVGVALNIVIFITFLRLAFELKALPEPVWFPATVSIGILALSGSHMYNNNSFNIVLIPGMFLCLAILVTVLFFPPAVYRTLLNPQTLAVSPEVFILQAPGSFIALGWFNLKDHNDDLVLLDHDWIGYTLFVFSTLGFLFTVLAVFQRRGALLQMLHDPRKIPTWSAATFPLVSTANSAVLLSLLLNPDQGLQIYAILLGVATVIVVVAINTRFLLYSVSSVKNEEKVEMMG